MFCKRTLLTQKLTLVVDISGDDSVFVVGTYKSDLPVRNAGSAPVFQYNKDNEQWQQVGKSVKGSHQHEEFGIGVALSQDASLLVVGSWYKDPSKSGPPTYDA